VFLVYLGFLFMRPMELFAPWLAVIRPMAILWLIAFFGSLMHVLSERDQAASARHYWTMAGLWFAVLISLVMRGRVGDAIDAAIDFSSSVLLFYLISFNLLTIERLRKACFVIVMCLTTISLVGIYSYHTGYKSDVLVLPQYKGNENAEIPEELPTVPADDDSGAYMWRLRGVGFLNDPNDFAQALVMGLPMLWWFVRKGAWFRNAFCVGLPASILVYAVVLSQSRGAILGIASILFLGVRKKLGNFKTVMLMGIAGAGVVVVGMTGGRAMSSKERSAEERIEAWEEGFRMLKSSPIFGVGYDQFIDNHYLTAHNSFVLGFSELGLFGYFFWIAIIALGFMGVERVVKYAPPGSEENLAGNILKSSLVGYVTCAWFLSRTYQPVLFCLLALCTAAWVCASRSPAYPNIPEMGAPLKHAKLTIMMMMGTMLAVYGFIFMHHIG
jgi:hypothetical protein